MRRTTTANNLNRVSIFFILLHTLRRRANGGMICAVAGDILAAAVVRAASLNVLRQMNEWPSVEESLPLARISR
jgi:hypothetical protein